MVVGDPVALLVTVTVPLRAPAVIGENTTLNVIRCAAASVTGVLAPLSAKPVPVSVMPEIVTLELPVFEIVTLCVEDTPVFTLPKDRLVALKDSV